MPPGWPIDHAVIHDQHQDSRAHWAGAVDWPRWAALCAIARGAEVRLLELDAAASLVQEMRAPAEREHLTSRIASFQVPRFPLPRLLSTAGDD